MDIGTALLLLVLATGYIIAINKSFDKDNGNRNNKKYPPRCSNRSGYFLTVNLGNRLSQSLFTFILYSPTAHLSSGYFYI